jgi:hypothetical protein
VNALVQILRHFSSPLLANLVGSQAPKKMRHAGMRPRMAHSFVISSQTVISRPPGDPTRLSLLVITRRAPKFAALNCFFEKSLHR